MARSARAALCLALALIAVPAAGAEAHGQRPASPASASIVGGQTASTSQDPWIARIEHRGESGAYWCTGTVISPRVILTAAHCILTEGGGLATAAGYTVLTSSANLHAAGSGVVSSVAERLIFPGYDPAAGVGDAGLLILTTPVTAPPIHLATAKDSGLLKAGTGLEVAGWGFTSGSSQVVPTVLGRTETTVQSEQYCREQVAAFLPSYYPSLQLCVIAPPSFTSGTCHGDSGGPAIAYPTAGVATEVGIIDLGDPECSTQIPSVFVRVDQISGWAFRWIAATELGAPPPEIAVPEIVVPKLKIADAKQLAGYALGEDRVIGSRFESGKAIKLECRRVRRSAVKCGVSWYQGADDFYGSITVIIAKYVSGEGIYPASRYRINIVNDHCAQTRPSCKVTTISHGYSS